MTGIITAGALIGAGALYKGITGAVQAHKANVIDRNNIRPIEAVDPLYQQNVNTAQHMADQGIPQEVINNQTNAINQNQASAIGAVGNSANPGANIASIVRQGNTAMGNLNAEQAAARNKATLALIQQRGIFAGAKQNAWNYNYADKYSEQLAKSEALRGAGMQNEAGAANSLIGAGTAIAGRGNYKILTTNLASNGYGAPIDAGYVGDTGLSGQYNNAV